MRRIYISIENIAGLGSNCGLFTSCLKSSRRNFSKRPSCPSECLSRAVSGLFEVETRSVRLTQADSSWPVFHRQRFISLMEPSTFSVTGQTPRRPANSVKITFRKKHLASTDTLTGGGPVSPHQSAARWGPDAIPGPHTDHSDHCSQAGTSLPWVMSQNPAPLLTPRSWLLV